MAKWRMWHMPKFTRLSTANIYDLSPDVDNQNSPDLNGRGPLLAGPISCAIDPTQSTSQSTRYVSDPAPHGYTQFKMFTDVNPMVTHASQQVEVTSVDGIVKTYMATGAAVEPLDIGRWWTTDLEYRA